jgi:hypothetical protein
MKKNFLWVLVALAMSLTTSVTLTSCGDDDDSSTAGGFDVSKFDGRITQQIPAEYLEKLTKYMPLYDGKNPVKVEGIYFFAPEMVFDETGNKQAGARMANELLRFDQQKSDNIIRVTQKFISGESSSSTEAYIMGSGNNFSIVTFESGNQYGVPYKTANIYSGTWTQQGLTNFYHGLMMISKDDPNNKVLPVGACRVFKSTKELCDTVSWDYLDR